MHEKHPSNIAAWYMVLFPFLYLGVEKATCFKWSQHEIFFVQEPCERKPVEMWPWVKSQIVAVVNINQSTTKTGSKMGGEFTYPDPIGFEPQPCHPRSMRPIHAPDRSISTPASRCARTHAGQPLRAPTPHLLAPHVQSFRPRERFPKGWKHGTGDLPFFLVQPQFLYWNLEKSRKTWFGWCVCVCFCGFLLFFSVLVLFEQYFSTLNNHLNNHRAPSHQVGS